MPTPAMNRKPSARARVWPAATLPAGLSVLLALAVWLFAGKVEADQERADAAALRLESYARLEAGDLASRAQAVVNELAAGRRAGRQGQERNLRLEVRGVMDAAHRVLSASMEKSRAAAAARRDVGVFPPGFDGVRGFLEIAPPAGKADRAGEALRAIAPELAELLPSGCSLAVVEDNSREILSIGGGSLPADAVREAMTRDFLFDDGEANRLWTIRVEVGAADAFPVPDAAELAAAVTDSLGATRLDGAVWRGWLLGAEGQVAATFPVAATGDVASASAPQPAGPDAFPPFIDKPREWVEIDGLRLVWLETTGRLEDADFTPAVSVAIDRPAPPLDVLTEFKRDSAWCATLVILAGLAVAGWAWFLRTLVAGAAAQPASAAGAAGKSASVAAAVPQRRLVRDAAAARARPDAAGGVIVADLDEGTVRLAVAEAGEAEEAEEAEPARRQQPPPLQLQQQQQQQAKREIPSGSLYRLQAIHRGAKAAAGSRALDGAKSAVLRELAARVRPVLRARADRMPGRGTERIAREVREVKKVQTG